jgi:hypothetical protein
MKKPILDPKMQSSEALVTKTVFEALEELDTVAIEMIRAPLLDLNYKQRSRDPFAKFFKPLCQFCYTADVFLSRLYVVRSIADKKEILIVDWFEKNLESVAAYLMPLMMLYTKMNDEHQLTRITNIKDNDIEAYFELYFEYHETLLHLAVKTRNGYPKILAIASK